MKDPAFLFYSNDFIGGVSDLTMEERGQYITLLCLQHQKGHISQKAIDINIGKVSADVISKFKVDEAGLFYNERLEVEIEKRRKHSEKQRENIAKRWGNKDTKDVQNNIPNVYGGNTVVLPLENENVNRDIIDFIEYFNTLFGKKYKITDKVKKSFNARISEKYTMEQIKQAVIKLFNDEYHREQSYKYATPEYLLRPDQLNKWVNATESNDSIWLSPSDQAEIIKYINAVSAEQWDDTKIGFELVTDINAIYCKKQMKYVTWDMITKCERLKRHAEDLFKKRELSTRFNPAGYGKK